MKILSPDANAGGAGGDQVPEPQTDFAKIKEELQAANVQQFNQMQENVINNVRSMLTGFTQARAEPEDTDDGEPSTQNGFSNTFADMRDDFEALGVDDDDKANALMNIVNKVVKKQVPGFEKKILNTVDQKEAHRNRKAQLDLEARTHYPDVVNPNSALFKETSRIWKEELSQAVKDSPDGTSLAIARAAQRLGIAPLTPQQIRQMESGNPTGDGPSGPRKSNEPSQNTMEFAAAFGVNPKIFKEKLKIVGAK